MPNLAIEYSRELARELGKIAVYMPGERVRPGDFLYFKDGRANWRKWWTVPWGSFEKISDLDFLKVEYSLDVPGPKDSYIFASRGRTAVNFTASASGVPLAVGTVPAAGHGKLTVGFTTGGATYFAAVGCERSQISDLGSVEDGLQDVARKSLYWKDVFLVTSVTTADRALIMQSSSSASSLALSGGVEGLVPGAPTKIGAGGGFNFDDVSNPSFIQPWNANVAVMMTLRRIRRRGDVLLLAAEGGGAKISGEPSGAEEEADGRFVTDEVDAAELLEAPNKDD
jgi:hypothetical protein